MKAHHSKKKNPDDPGKHTIVPSVPPGLGILPAKEYFKRFTSHKKSAILIIVFSAILILLGISVLVKSHKSISLFPPRSGTPDAAITHFTIVSTSPKDLSTGNSPNTPIKIIFSQPVRPDSLRGYFTVSPMIPGEFTQGDSLQEVVFKAKYTFGESTSVKVIINKGLESIAGNKLASDYTYNFSTRISDRHVVFESDNIYSRWMNLPTGRKISFTVRTGDDGIPNGTITVYKGTFDVIVSSLLYKNETHEDSNYITQTFLDYPISTSKMQKVLVKEGIVQDAPFEFNQPEGLYYVEAKSDGKVVGSTWVNVNDEGLIVRQDDQKVTIATQNIKTGFVDTRVKVLLYNLQDKPTLLHAVEIGRYGEIPIEYPQKVDLVVGETANGVILVPLTIPETQADIRLNSNLTNLDKILVSTHKPTYMPKDTVQFSGVLRRDNDAKYTLPQAGDSVRVWVVEPNDDPQKEKTILEQTVSVNEGGIFSGQFTLSMSLTPTEGNNMSLTLYAKAVREGAKYITSRSYTYTTFDVVSQASGATIAVSFDKQKYTKNEQVVAHIVGRDSAGQPLANKSITYTLYAKNYYEHDPESVATFGNELGETIAEDQSIVLDAHGQAEVTLDKRDNFTSEAITLKATTDVDSIAIYGAKTVLVQQGNIVLAFGPSRQTYHTGDTTIHRVYAKDLSGKPSENLDLQYKVSGANCEKQECREVVLGEGVAKTDVHGFALIRQPVTTEDRSVTLRVIAKDSMGNSIQADRSIDILAAGVQPSDIYYHNFTLSNLDVAMDKLSYNVGDIAHLTINAPFDQRVLVTYESGRIYHNEWLQLHAGDNDYTIAITSQLSPSFNLVFSYFHNESLFVEGLPLSVSDVSKTLGVTIAMDKNSYTKNDSAQITVTTKDNAGQPTKANVLVNILEDTIFNLRDNLLNSNVGWYFYSPRLTTTNFSASTLGIGFGGGCGGGSGIDIRYVPNNIGKNMYWNPHVVTDQNGEAKITVPLSDTSGRFRIFVTAINDATAVGQSQSILSVQ